MQDKNTEYKKFLLGNRLYKAIELLGYKNTAQYAEKNGVKRSTMYAIVDNKQAPSSSILEIFRKSGIDTNWLISGEGEPLLREGGKSDEPNLDDALKKVFQDAGRTAMDTGSVHQGGINVEQFDRIDLLDAMRQIIKKMDNKELDVLMDAIKLKKIESQSEKKIDPQ